jgi:hypothetical protein
VIISAGVASRSNCQAADDMGGMTNARVSAFHTRNAVLTFAILGLILMLADTILHVTKLINRLPSSFDTIVSKKCPMIHGLIIDYLLQI